MKKVIVALDVPDECDYLSITYSAEGEQEIKTGDYDYDSYAIDLLAIAYESLPMETKRRI